MTARTFVSPPRDEHELLARARSLAGRTLEDLAIAIGFDLAGPGVRTKGKVGALLEAALGATGGSAKQHDFPALAIELKTIPVDEAGRARESTYVCTLPLDDVENATWAASWVRAKLAYVLWVPVAVPDRAAHDAWGARSILPPVVWRPTREQEEILAIDFDEIVGAIAIGGIEGLTARTGRWLQARPKAADGTRSARAYGTDGEAIATVPRGFYLRARFTSALLRDPAALPE